MYLIRCSKGWMLHADANGFTWTSNRSEAWAMSIGDARERLDFAKTFGDMDAKIVKK